MEPTAILGPIAAQVLLFFVIAGALGYVRWRDIAAKRVRIQDSAIDYDIWSDRAMQVANCYRNQFEMPVLFYLVCVLALITRTVDHTFLYLAWAYVGFRVVHAAIHMTINIVALRGLALFGSAIVLIAMWILFLSAVSAATA